MLLHFFCWSSQPPQNPQKKPRLKKWCLLCLSWLGVKSANWRLWNNNKKGRIATVNNAGPVPAIPVSLSLYLHCPNITIFQTFFLSKALVTCRDNDMMQETLLRCFWTLSTSQLHPEQERTTKTNLFQSISIFVWCHYMLTRQSKQWLLNNAVPIVKHKNKYSCMLSSIIK